MKGGTRYGDAGIKDHTENPDEPNIYIYDVGTCSLNCKLLEPLEQDFGKRKNGDGARHVRGYKEKKYQREFQYGTRVHIKILAFDTGTGCIDGNTKLVLKEIAKFVCIGQSSDDDYPSDSVIAMRH